MMKIAFGKLVLATGVVATLFCCDGKGVEDDYKDLIGKEIKIPYGKFVPLPSETSTDERYKWTYVSFVDSLECTPCHMSSVHNWDRIQEVFEEKGTNVKIVCKHSILAVLNIIRESANFAQKLELCSI